MSKIIIDPLQFATLDLEALESDAYASGDAGLAALVARLIDAEDRWSRLLDFVDNYSLVRDEYATEIIAKIDELDKGTKS